MDAKAKIFCLISTKMLIYLRFRFSIYALLLLHLYPPVTRKRQWRYVLDGPAPA